MPSPIPVRECCDSTIDCQHRQDCSTTPSTENDAPDWDDLDDESPGCDHDWLDRPESDTHVCLACGEEDTGPPPRVFSPGSGQTS